MAKNKKRKLQHHAPPKPQYGAKKQKPQQRKPEPTIPFDPLDRILLIGEGDFSFAKSLIEHHGCCDVTATCLDSQTELFEKYTPQAEEHVTYLEDEGQTVLYGVDATKLDKNKSLIKSERFDVAMFNFPHVGGKSTDVNRQVRFNQELLVEFFRAVPALLKPGATIVVTLFEGEPYTLWNVRDLARHTGLEVVRSFRFEAGAYPGYSHARTLGNIEGGGGWKGEERESRSYVFRVKGGEAGRETKVEVKGKRKRGNESSDDEG